jgi:hypothetical protein
MIRNKYVAILLVVTVFVTFSFIEVRAAHAFAGKI